MKAAGKRHKGNRFERFIASLYRKHGFEATRMPGSGAFESLKGDIRFHTYVPFSVECKNQEKATLWPWWKQAREQATDYEYPVLFITRNNAPSLGVVEADVLIRLQAIAREKDAQ